MSISADALELLESGELPLCMDVESLFRLSKYFNIPIADLFRPIVEIAKQKIRTPESEQTPSYS